MIMNMSATSVVTENNTFNYEAILKDKRESLWVNVFKEKLVNEENENFLSSAYSSIVFELR